MARKSDERVELSGISLSQGVAFGKTFRFRQIDLDSLKENRFPINDIKKEHERLRQSIEKSKEQLERLYNENTVRSRKDVAEIFNAQVQLISDRAFIQSILEGVENERLNSEHILYKKILDLESSFNSIENEIIRTKLSDIQDVYHRLLRNLLDIEHVRVTPLSRAVKNPILLAERLLPSDIALLELKKIRGIIIEEASTVSHVAIIAKSLGIPVVTGVPGIGSLIDNESVVVVDGVNGRIVINPTLNELVIYRRKRRLHTRYKSAVAQHPPSVTSDGVRVSIEANANTIREIEEAFERGAEGIGLLRTEMFYLSRTKMPTEKEEEAFYRRVHEIRSGKPVTIRLLDLGADKRAEYMRMPSEENPQLGIRGIRYLFSEGNLLDRHLTSILRSACDGPVRIMVPFVSMVDEIKRICRMIDIICKRENVDRRNIRIGVMIEVPSILWHLADIREYVDFLSVGTNDLVQYLFAAGREDGRLDNYRKASLPVIFSIIRYIVDFCTSQNLELSICGEIASDPEIAPILVGLGCRNLSVRVTAIEDVRREIGNRTIAEMKVMADNYLPREGDIPLGPAG